MFRLDIAYARKTIADFIRQTAQNGVVVGLSGGVDSALVAALCAEAVGKDKVLGIIMPSATTAQEDVNDANEFAATLGIEHKTIDIEGVLSAVGSLLNAEPRSLASSNLAPRLRMAVLYYYANLLSRIVAGTGNRSELMIGYFTKHGDGGVDILPIGDLYKSEVRVLAKGIGIPEKIINKPPTAGLWPGQTDEDEIGLSYAELDKILAALFDNKETPEQASESTGTGADEIRRVAAMHKKNEHKLRTPSIAKIR